jgi:hypothetical protein
VPGETPLSPGALESVPGPPPVSAWPVVPLSCGAFDELPEEELEHPAAKIPATIGTSVAATRHDLRKEDDCIDLYVREA